MRFRRKKKPLASEALEQSTSCTRRCIFNTYDGGNGWEPHVCMHPDNWKTCKAKQPRKVSNFECITESRASLARFLFLIVEDCRRGEIPRYTEQFFRDWLNQEAPNEH